MKTTILDVIVIGAGHAGLSASYYLKQSGINHLVFERGRIGESWRSQRWDSFVMNSPGWINALPGDYQVADDPGEFCTTRKYVSSLENFVSNNDLPVAEEHRVVSVDKQEGDRYFTVGVATSSEVKSYSCRQVLICSGSQNKIKIPAITKDLGSKILQLHASEYRNASQLPNGAVLVVGSGQSGCQVADDLACNGKKVYLSTSRVGRLPRRYRGKDIIEWLMLIKFFDVPKENISDPNMLIATPPQITGVNGGMNTISLQSLARKGVAILGRMESVNESIAVFQPNAGDHVQFADGFSQNFRNMLDKAILDNHIEAPPPEMDAADLPDPEASCASAIISLDLSASNIESVIWTTGFTADFSFIKLPVLDHSDFPIQQEGVSPVEGLYFLGLPWLRNRKSGLLGGITDDAKILCGKLCESAGHRVLAHG